VYSHAIESAATESPAFVSRYGPMWGIFGLGSEALKGKWQT